MNDSKNKIIYVINETIFFQEVKDKLEKLKPKGTVEKTEL